MSIDDHIKSITDKTLDVRELTDEEFEAKWLDWLESDLSIGYRTLLEDEYDLEDVNNLPIPEDIDFNQEEDEVLSQILDSNLLMILLRDNPDLLEKESPNTFRINGTILKLTDIYCGYLLDVVRLWRYAFKHIKTTYKLIRRIWYKGFKIFAQTLRGNDFTESEDSNLTSAVGKWVKSGLMRYTNLYIQDKTRKIFHNDRPFGFKNVFLAVEKDAATDELIELAWIVGASYVLSGKGVPSNAATEKALLLSNFKTQSKEALQEYIEKYPHRKKVVLVIVSDYDHAGMNGVAGGFIQQFKLLCEQYGLELAYKRVGLFPKHVPEHRLKPSYALFSPPLRAAIRCNNCKEWEGICNDCGKKVNIPKNYPNHRGSVSCSNKDRNGDKCESGDIFVFKIPTKVKARDSRTGFLRKEDRNIVKAEPNRKHDFINKDPCPRCKTLDQDISIESNGWFVVYGVPYCETHDICHTVEIDEFSDKDLFKEDESCVITRYGIELDSLGASYYYKAITEYLIEELGIEVFSDWIRKQMTPRDYDYKNESDTLASSKARENDQHIELSNESQLFDDAIRSIRELQEPLTTKIDQIEEEYKESIWDQSNDFFTEKDFDDRQREYNHNSDNWNTEKTTEMYKIHSVKLLDAVKRKSRAFTGWDETGSNFALKKSSLTYKFKNLVSDELDNDVFELPEEIEFDKLSYDLISERMDEYFTYDERYNGDYELPYEPNEDSSDEDIEEFDEKTEIIRVELIKRMKYKGIQSVFTKSELEELEITDTDDSEYLDDETQEDLDNRLEAKKLVDTIRIVNELPNVRELINCIGKLVKGFQELDEEYSSEIVNQMSDKEFAALNLFITGMDIEEDMESDSEEEEDEY